MKKIITLLLTILLLSSCKTVVDNPEQILLDTLQKHLELTNLTTQGKVDLKVGKEGNVTIPVKVDVTAMLDNKANQDIDDDETYSHIVVPVLFTKYEIQTWSKDGYLYVNDGNDTKRYTIGSLQDKVNLSINDILQLIVEYTEEYSVSTNGSNTVITITPKYDLIKQLLGNLLKSNNIPYMDRIDTNKLLENAQASDIVMTINSEGYIKNIKTSIKMTYNDYQADADLDFDFKDLNKTSIPELKQ